VKSDPRRILASLGIIGILTLLAACDPPGKPKLSDDEVAAPADFKTIFAQNCSGCHGNDGQKGPGRVLNNPLYLKVSTKENIRGILVNGRPGTLMPAFAKSNGGPLTDKQIDTLVSGMESEWAKPFTASDIPSYDGTGFTGDPENGRKLFAKSCYACHAKGGVAGALLDPSYLSLSSNQNLRTSIIVGRPDFPGLPMPDYRSLKMGHALDNQDIADLVAFLSSKRPANSALAMTLMQSEK
jgi:mono/diheme cytochrome c family protein